MEIDELAKFIGVSGPKSHQDELNVSVDSEGYALPDDYRDFVSMIGDDGTVPSSRFEYLHFSRKINTFNPAFFCSILIGADHPIRSLKQSFNDFDQNYGQIPIGLYTIAHDQRGNFLTIDLRTDSFGQIAIVGQAANNDNSYNPANLDVVASSFSEFVQFCRINKETPISSDRAKAAGVWAVLHLMAYSAGAGLAWGFALKHNLIWSITSGATVGFLLSAFLVFPVVAKQQTEERTKDMMFAAGAIWGNIAILAGVVGLVVWIIRLIFS